MDLDNFKQVNDCFDHTRGDRVLQAVAAALQNELEPSDLVARRGGDEFAALVCHPATRNLDELRSRLERAITTARMASCPQVTPSGSVAYICTRPGEEISAIMERADQALHDSKRASRNRYRTQIRASHGPEIRASDEPEIRASDGPEIRASDGPASGDARGPWQRAARLLSRCGPDWRSAALLLATGGVIIAALSLSGMVEPLTPLAGGAIALGWATLALGCLIEGGLGLPVRRLHAMWILAYGLLALQIVLAGSAGVALLDLIPAIAMFGFLLFSGRTAALYMLGGDVMYGLFAVGGGYQEGVVRTAVSSLVVAVVGGLVLKLRLVTVRFARRNLELSEVDALTGVANIRALRARMSDMIERASSQEWPRLLSIDLDEFKQVNDEYSHSTGDRVLVAVARAIAERMRADDLVARRGGDEFVVVMGDAKAEEVQLIAQRISDGIAKARTRLCPDVRPTATIASVVWQPGETADELLREADLALHEKKAQAHRLGRDAPLLTA